MVVKFNCERFRGPLLPAYSREERAPPKVFPRYGRYELIYAGASMCQNPSIFQGRERDSGPISVTPVPFPLRQQKQQPAPHPPRILKIGRQWARVPRLPPSRTQSRNARPKFTTPVSEGAFLVM